jgi:hypothetical protein
MRSFRVPLPCSSFRLMALFSLLGLAASPLGAGGLRLARPALSEPSESATADSEPGPEAKAGATAEVIVEPSSEPETVRKDVSWLGISTIEASEALSSQLDLDPGVGLVITYVAPDSPAGKAGLRKNDVLTQFDNQDLVHPAQLRKMVRVRRSGDVVKLGYYRAGKHETVSVALGKTRAEAALWQDSQHALTGNLKEWQNQIRSLHIDDAVRDQMRVLKESLGNIKMDQKEVQEDIRRGMDQARTTIRDALRNMTNADSALNPVRKILENLAHSGVVVDDKTDVVVRSSGKSVKSMVKTDDSGTIVLLSNPGLHLTAHDKDGKLLFDGPIDTAEQRAKVPHDLWERVDPLVDQMHSGDEQPEANEPDKKDNPSPLEDKQ